MYTTVPLIDPNTVHTGFWLLFAMFFLIAAFCAAATIEVTDAEGKSIGKIVLVHIGIFTALMAYPFYDSFIYQRPIPKNEPVTAHKVMFDSTTAMTSGKYPKQYIAGIVIYKTPDGEVTFKTHDGMVYPDTVVLYKN